MSDTNTLDLTNITSEPVESNIQVEISDAPVEEEVSEEVAETEEPVVATPDPVPEPVAPDDTEEPVEEPVEVVEPVVATPDPVPEPVASDEVVEPAPTEPVEEESVSTEEVVENVKEILNSDNTISCNNCNCEERVKVLEERLDKLVDILKNRSWRSALNTV